jgi:hypothetical protein
MGVNLSHYAKRQSTRELSKQDGPYARASKPTTCPSFPTTFTKQVSRPGHSGLPVVAPEAEQVELTPRKDAGHGPDPRLLCATGSSLPGQRPDLIEATLFRHNADHGSTVPGNGAASGESGSRLDGGANRSWRRRPLSRCSRLRSRWSSRGMGSVSRAETEPGQRKCSAESSERSSLATTPEPRRDRLGSLPTPHPRFPPPSIPKIGDLHAAGQTHDAELSLCLIGWAGDQRPRGRRPM